jgi:beta-lactamase class A
MAQAARAAYDYFLFAPKRRVALNKLNVHV